MYLDVASAAPWHPRALDAHAQVAQAFPGDPTRLHGSGRAASDLLSRARQAVAAELGGSPDRLTFTSGATEAIHLAVRGTAAVNRRRPPRILSTAVEHSAVLAAAEATGLEHVRLPVDAEGAVSLDALEHELTTAGAVLVNVQHANHEVGTVQPVTQVATLCRAHDALLHVDAAQTAGRWPVDLEDLGADYLSISAAKFGGGRGVGALLTSHRARFQAVTTGDEREGRRRSGLQNLPGIVAMAETLAALAPRDPAGEAATHRQPAAEIRALLRRALADLPDVEVHGPDVGGLEHVVACSALYVEGQALVSALDASGYELHSGSSCATTSGEPSHVLVAMGALTHGHVRISFGPPFDSQAAAGFISTFGRVVAEQRARLGM